MGRRTEHRAGVPERGERLGDLEHTKPSARPRSARVAVNNDLRIVRNERFCLVTTGPWNVVQVASRWPYSGGVFAALLDPVDGDQITVDKVGGRLCIAVLDVSDPDTAIVTRYLVGSAYAPSPPPLLRHVGPAIEPWPASTSFRDRLEVTALNYSMTAFQVSADDMAALLGKAARALHGAGLRLRRGV